MKQLIAAILVFSSMSVAEVNYKKLHKGLKIEFRQECKGKAKTRKVKSKCKLIKSQLFILRELIDEQKKAQACIFVYDPVCGVDGKTYSNICFADSHGVEVAHAGECF